MQAESLQVLESASVAPAQARAIVRAIEIEITGAKDTLATKHDVLALHHALDVLRAELRSEMTAFAAQLRAEMAQLVAQMRGEMAKQIDSLRSETAKQIDDLRSEIKDLRKEVGGATRQMYVALLGQTAVLLGFFYFFIAELR
jgi:gas vesicle protein